MPSLSALDVVECDVASCWWSEPSSELGSPPHEGLWLSCVDDTVDFHCCGTPTLVWVMNCVEWVRSIDTSLVGDFIMEGN